MNKVTAVLILALIAMGAWVFRAYGDARAEGALRQRAQDSLQTVTDQFRLEEEERVAARTADSVQIQALTHDLGVARQGMARAGARAEMVAGALRDHLANDTTVSDTVRVLVVEAIEAAEAETRACQGALTACDSISAAQERTILSMGLTVADQDSLLVAYQGQLDDAVRAANPGLFTKAKRSIPLVLGSVAAGYLLAQVIGN